MRWWRDPEVVLSALCAVFLVASFAPGAHSLVYASIAAGSVFALKTTWESLRDRRIDVNLLMVLAAAGAIFVGEPRDAAILLFLFALSGALESLTMTRTKSAIEALIQLRPTTAWKVVDGVADQVPVESLALGDQIQLPPFQNIPADCRVLTGESSVDNSALTGESVPVPVQVGSELFAGTQNLAGSLLAEVTATVGDSSLDRIVALVEEAQTNQAAGERIATWFGQRYTVFVLAAFTISLIIRLLILKQPLQQGAYESLILLVALSPCALVISTPASTLSALAWCARHGLLVRGGRVIEAAGEVNAVTLDKTGTITSGKPALLQILLWDRELVVQPVGQELDSRVSEALRMAQAVEQFSPHPMAHALKNFATSLGLDGMLAQDAEEIPGVGVSGIVEGRKIVVGQRDESDLPAPMAEALVEHRRLGRSVAFLDGGEHLTAFVFGDDIRPEARPFLARLRELGIREVQMLSGDKEAPASAVAAQIGLSSFKAQLHPAEKVAYVADLAKRHRVMMVGDGINDGPALAHAHVGVAMGKLGSDVAMNAAGVVLMHDNLLRIADLICLGKRTRRIIRANLLFATGVILTLTVSSLVTRLPLPIAVLGHEGSTVLVILNGLRLLKGP